MPDRYAVIGHPIAHSKSPFIHGLFAQATGQDMVYEAIDGGAEPGGFERALAAFRAAGGRGMNVTLPFKLAALAVADSASEDARLAGAANTLSFEGGRIEARNTDGIGLVRDIEVNLGLPLAGRRVLLLGAGGATRGAVRPIARAGAARIVIANRTADKAEALAAELAPHLGGVPLVGCGLAALGTQGAFDVVINATSASLDGQAPAVPAGAFAPGALAYDMVYGKGLTPFLRLARQAGCARLADGVGMLVEQAAEAFAAWRGVRPDTREALARLTVPLA
ncbi:MAG TPA: shikimate dehydrogenase [Ottowia sp.]|jgi:shikimate dehydrogenase|nr:MAG: shikimate dehydrogenase [Burkholderiales bacterium 68-10]HMT64915.1 shikimate dehydrogenase [Ottowia sp.]HMT82389.1 shikimate dehydrogenase [Ottowia sp.]HQZ56989.1 shikimate dehydrogenase [Ottowia sp.]HRB09820.1 shikimate dehydrogenase [Ottowia sp.]